MSYKATRARHYARRDVEAVSAVVVEAACKVHRTLGPGLLESVYEACLAHELTVRGIGYARQLAVPVVYEGIRIERGFRLDFLVEDSLVVELKAVQNHNPLFEAQTRTYMRLTNCRRGLLINFSVPKMTHGIRQLEL